jgi:hypothetical protein
MNLALFARLRLAVVVILGHSWACVIRCDSTAAIPEGLGDTPVSILVLVRTFVRVRVPVEARSIFGAGGHRIDREEPSCDGIVIALHVL